MRTHSRLALAALTLALAPRGTHAQAPLADSVHAHAPVADSLHASDVRALAVGDTVRIRCTAGRYAGHLTRLTGDTLYVAAAGREDAVPRGDVTELLRFSGRGSRGTAILLGAGVGLAAGAGVGLMGGRSAGRLEHCAPAESCTPGTHDRTAVGAFTALGGLVGALLGAMVGPTFRGTRWQPVTASAASPVHLEVAPAAGGGLGVGGHLRL